MKKLAEGIFELLKSEGHLHEGEVGRGVEGRVRFVDKLFSYLTIVNGTARVIQKLEHPTIEERVQALHVRKWGNKGTVSKTYTKLVEEVGELGGGLIADDMPNIVEEAGDVLIMVIVLMQLKSAVDYSFEDLATMSLDKFEARLNASEECKVTGDGRHRVSTHPDHYGKCANCGLPIWPKVK